MNLNKYQVTQKYIPIRRNTRSGLKLTTKLPLFLVAHDTGNAGATAENHFNYFKDLVDQSKSAHTFIDDKQILEIIPTGLFGDAAEKAWHVMYDKPKDNELFGEDANDAAIGVELCFGGSIDFEEAYKRYVWYFALLCFKFNKDPRKMIVGHETLDPIRKTDPTNALKRYGKTYAQFIADVVAELAEEEEHVETVKTSINGVAGTAAVMHEGSNYVKASELAKLGIKVEWDNVNKVLKLSK